MFRYWPFMDTLFRSLNHNFMRLCWFMNFELQLWRCSNGAGLQRWSDLDEAATSRHRQQHFCLLHLRQRGSSDVWPKWRQEQLFFFFLFLFIEAVYRSMSRKMFFCLDHQVEATGHSSVGRKPPLRGAWENLPLPGGLDASKEALYGRLCLKAFSKWTLDNTR